MKQRLIYPIDTDQFEKIRINGKLYVDKTGLINDIINVKKYEYVFLARPRRFGKSLLCNTIHAYFEGRKELFEGLKIAETEKEWKKFPVLHFTLSGLKNLTVPEAKTKLESFIRNYEKIYGRDPETFTPGDRFRELIHRAKEQTGMPVVVLLDEYDTPLLKLMYSEDLPSMRAMLQEFYQVLKDEGAYLRFVFITGITKFSQLSIFSELNNLKQISMLDEYSSLCGITQEELDTVLRPGVEEFAEANNCKVDEAYALLKKNYDGYHFSEQSQDIYAPFSLLNALCDKRPNQYWFETSTSSSLIEHLRHFPEFNVLECDGIEVMADEFNIACEDADTPIPLLYQSGYLSIDTFEREYNTFVLHFPNNEVRNGMIKSLAPIVLKKKTADNNALVRQMAKSINGGDISTALNSLRSYISSIPYDIITKDEWEDKDSRESFYKLLFYMAFSMLNSLVDTEVKSVRGRADVVIQTKKDVFVLELKVDDTVDTALQQIDDKGYTIPYSADGRKITKCGVSISSEKRNITHWKATDEKAYGSNCRVKISTLLQWVKLQGGSLPPYIWIH